MPSFRFDLIIFNPTGPPFQSFARPGGRGLRGPDAKNQHQHQPIEMKLSIGLYILKSIPDAKFEADSSSSFRYDVTKFPSKEGNKSSDSAIYLRKTGLT